jgi:hypothetical protein
VNFLNINHWDIVLIIVVSAQATLLAYLHHPRWKAFLLNLPLPFTIATLSVGQPIDITNMTGFILLLVYAHCVRILNWRLKIKIIPAIVISALLYCVLGTWLAVILPRTEKAFWLMSAVVLTAAVSFHLALPHHEEPGHRSSLPVAVKLVVVMGIIAGLVMIKQSLQGFMTMFPMVSLVAFYEARHSLWTMCRQIPVIILTMLPMVLVIRLTQPWLGYAWALIPGWIVFLAVLIPLTRLHLKTLTGK